MALGDFGGELGCELAWTPVALARVPEFSAVYRRVDDLLRRAKETKFRGLLAEPEFLTPDAERPLPRRCARPAVAPAQVPGGVRRLCKQCEIHQLLGDQLPKRRDGYLGLPTGSRRKSFRHSPRPSSRPWVWSSVFDPGEAKRWTETAVGETTLLRVNDVHGFWLPTEVASLSVRLRGQPGTAGIETAG